MCYLKFHECKYCNEEYQCTLPNNICPTINADRDTNMCEGCKGRLEEIIAKYNLDIAVLSLEQIMELE